MRTVRLNALTGPSSVSIIKFQTCLKIINISPNFHIRLTEEINRLEQKNSRSTEKCRFTISETVQFA